MDPALGPPAAGYPPPPDVIGLGGAGQGALVLHGSTHGKGRAADSDDDSDSDSNGEPPKEIGDVDPSRCKVSGPGFSGAAAGMPVQLYIYAHDAYNRRLRSGGDEVVVRVSPASSAMQLQAPIEVTVVDNDNGTYTASYTPPIKGNYMLSVEVNYLPISGSPFPVFFSNPLDPAEAAAAAAAAAGGPTPPGMDGLTPPPTSLDPAVQAMAAAAKQAINGVAAQADSAVRTVYVSNLSAAVSVDQYRQLFSIPGKIQDIKQAGEGASATLIIEYGTQPEADEAIKMNGMAVGDRSLVVQNGVVYQATASSLAAITAPPTAGSSELSVVVPSVVPPPAAMPGLPGMAGMPGLGMGMGMGMGLAGLPGMGLPGMGMPGLPGTDPFMAMQQMQQMQELQRIQSQMQANKQLAEQVARMRALARTSKGSGRNPEEERMKTTEAVLERLNRKLGAVDEANRRRSRSRSSSRSSRSSRSSSSSRSRSRGRRDRRRSSSRDRRDRERREQERRDRERRERERERERRERERREMERREQERRERDRRERERRERDRERELDRDRRRDRSRGRKRDDSPERRRDGSRDKRRERDSSKDKQRDASREGDRKARSKRSRSRTPDRKDGKGEERKATTAENADEPQTSGGQEGAVVKEGVKDDGEKEGERDRDESREREKSSRRKEKEERKREKKERKEKKKDKKGRREKGDKEEEEGDEEAREASEKEGDKADSAGAAE